VGETVFKGDRGLDEAAVALSAGPAPETMVRRAGGEGQPGL
jgi:hypothetical protein